MKNCIFQYYLPYKGDKTKPKWAEVGIKSARQYANNIGAEYVYSEEKYMHSALNVFETFRIFFDEYFDQFDKVFVLDIDTIVNTTDSIFDIEIGDVGMVHELGVEHRDPVPGASFTTDFWKRFFRHHQTGVVTYARNYLDKNFMWKKSTLYPNESFAIYNGGVQVWSKQGRLKARELFGRDQHDHFHKITGKGETPYLNMMLFHHNFEITELDTEWNRLYHMWTKDNDFGKITHFNDVKKEAMLTWT